MSRTAPDSPAGRETTGPETARRAAERGGASHRPAAALRLELPATCESLSLVHEFTRRAAIGDGFDERTAGDIAVAVNEAMTNVVEHAYRGEPGHGVTIRFFFGPGRLRIELEHRGEGPKALPEDPDPCRLAAERRTGGLGVHLMRKLMHRVEHEEEPKGGRWILERRRLLAADPSDGSAANG